MGVSFLSRLCPLFSGSSGNSIYIEHNNEAILIDAGRNAKQIEMALFSNNIDVRKIKSIFVTHEHSDHISGIRVFVSRYNLKLYAGEKTLNVMGNMGILNNKFEYDSINIDGVSVGEIHVKPFKTSHDSVESFGYVVNLGNKKIAVCTDLGYISNEVEKALLGCEVVLIESNHDVGMLENGRYPYFLKRRILSSKGHLSNEACANILPKLVNNGAKRFILSHLSSENNIPELAMQSSISSLREHNMQLNHDFTLDVAPKFNNNECNVIF